MGWPHQGKSMNSNVNRIRRARPYQLKIAATTRAIRSALALSAAMLALSGTSAALAGTCSITNPLEVTCTGDFTDDVATDVPALAQVEDLTLILDADTVVAATTGANGVSSTWGGDAVVISYADIDVQDAVGIYVKTPDGDASVDNHGEVYALANAASVSAVYAYASGDVSVVNSGEIIAQASNGTTLDAWGVVATSDTGVASVTNLEGGTIVGNSYNDTGFGIEITGEEGVVVNNAGLVGASSYNWFAGGVEAESFGYSSVTNSGTVIAYSTNGGSAAILSRGPEVASIDNSGSVYATGFAAWGLESISDGDTASIDNSGLVSVASFDIVARGLVAYGVSTDVYNSGTVDVGSYGDAYGIVLDGDVFNEATNAGVLNVSAYGI